MPQFPPQKRVLKAETYRATDSVLVGGNLAAISLEGDATAMRPVEPDSKRFRMLAR
jgi:hypothetical protein